MRGSDNILFDRYFMRKRELNVFNVLFYFILLQFRKINIKSINTTDGNTLVTGKMH